MAEENYWTRRAVRRISRRQVLVGGAAAGLGIVAAACGGGNTTKSSNSGNSGASSSAGGSATAAAKSQASSGTPKKGGTLKWGIEAGVASLDPIWTTATVTFELGNHLYDTLFAYDVNQKIQPVAAKDYSVSPDKLTYTINIRDDASFEGGRPMTAADVVASLQRWGKKSPAGVSLFAALNSLQAKGDKTVVLETKQPYSLVIDSLANFNSAFIMTKEAASTSPDTSVDQVTASGPFRLESWQKGSKIVLKPRTDYKSPPGTPSNAAGSRTVYIDSLEIPEIPDQTARLAAFQAGTIDVMTQPLSDYYDQLKSSQGTQLQVNDTGAYNIVLLNNTKPPFNNPLARQALLAGADVDKFMTAGWGKNLWKLCPGIFLCGSPNDSKVSADQYNQKNLTKAKQLFQQLQSQGGYDGRPLTLLSNTTYVWMQNQSQVTKQLLENIGFKVDLQLPDWATAVSKRPNKDSWDLFHTGGVHGVGANDPLRSLPLSPAWFGWYQSKQMDDLKQQYATATTPEQAHQVIDKVQELWYKDVPDLLLGIAQFYDVWKPYVKGYNNTPLQSIFWNVWLDR